MVIRYVPPTFDPYSFLRSFFYEAMELAPVALVAHLMARSGEGGMRRIGFDRTRLPRDIGLGVGLVAAAETAGVGLAIVAHIFDLPFSQIVSINPDAHASAIFLGLWTSAVAAVSEETIVNGYMLTRLDDLGWRPGRALIASTLLRASYHLYQGISGFIVNIVGGLVAGRIFQKTRRVMPLVVVHFLIDVVAVAVAIFWADRPAWLR